MMRKPTLLFIGLLLLLTMMQGAAALTYMPYGYAYSAGGYPPYTGHQYDSYGPNGWQYSYYTPSVGYYAYGYYSHYYAPYYNHYNVYGGYYGYAPTYYYRGYGTPWYYNYWPYTYRVYNRCW